MFVQEIYISQYLSGTSVFSWQSFKISDWFKTIGAALYINAAVTASSVIDSTPLFIFKVLMFQKENLPRPFCWWTSILSAIPPEVNGWLSRYTLTMFVRGSCMFLSLNQVWKRSSSQLKRKFHRIKWQEVWISPPESNFSWQTLRISAYVSPENMDNPGHPLAPRPLAAPC